MCGRVDRASWAPSSTERERASLPSARTREGEARGGGTEEALKRRWRGTGEAPGQGERGRPCTCFASVPTTAAVGVSAAAVCVCRRRKQAGSRSGKITATGRVLGSLFLPCTLCTLLLLWDCGQSLPPRITPPCRDGGSLGPPLRAQPPGCDAPLIGPVRAASPPIAPRSPTIVNPVGVDSGVDSGHSGCLPGFSWLSLVVVSLSALFEVPVPVLRPPPFGRDDSHFAVHSHPRRQKRESGCKGLDGPARLRKTLSGAPSLLLPPRSWVLLVRTRTILGHFFFAAPQFYTHLAHTAMEY